MVITNSFSLNMVAEEDFKKGPVFIRAEEVSLEEVRKLLEAEKEVMSGIGHPDTARLVSDMLGMDIPSNRITLKVKEGDEILVAQYTGPRLPEGATKLPEGATIKFFKVSVIRYRRIDWE